MNFKRLASLALGAATVASIAPAKAINVDSNHMALGQAIASTGVVFKINPVECFEGKAMGWYWAKMNELVVCQEYATQVNVETYWTPEDFDTLRHEAQHLIQDCMDGQRQGILGAVYQEPVRLGKEVLGAQGLGYIAEAYKDKGPHIVVLEVEAFAVAQMNIPLDQVADIQHYCL